MWFALGKTVVWTKLQFPIHIFCNYKWDTIDFISLSGKLKIKEMS